MEQAGELAAPAAIGQGGEFTAPVAWSGVGVALGPSVVGFFLLGVASVVWLVLQYAAGRRVAREQVQAEV